MAATRRTNTVEKILSTASELFYTHGLRGVSMDQVIAESGVAKSTLYVHFSTKDALVAAYLRRTDESWTGQLRQAAERAGDTPADQLAGLFDALSDAFDRHGFFGCPFIGVAVEVPLDSEARAITLEHTRRRQQWLTSLARAAGADEPDALARHVGLLIDGTLAYGRLTQDRAVVDDAKKAVRRLVADHTTAGNGPSS